MRPTYGLHRQPRFQTALAEFSSLYMQLLSVTTFTLTFFVNQSYTIWRTCLQTCRILQGRMNDLIMSTSGFQSTSGRETTRQFHLYRKFETDAYNYCSLYPIIQYFGVCVPHSLPSTTVDSSRHASHGGTRTHDSQGTNPAH